MGLYTRLFVLEKNYDAISLMYNPKSGYTQVILGNLSHCTTLSCTKINKKLKFFFGEITFFPF